jgi:acyl-CoA reductase-like NAD-dependent aldehyde dehydrogenase
VASAFRNAGQSCICANRVFVQASKALKTVEMSDFKFGFQFRVCGTDRVLFSGV